MSETGYLNVAEIFGENVFNDAVMPVSYTHLDVYKRQSIHSSERHRISHVTLSNFAVSESSM